MSKQPYLYRTMRWRWILIHIVANWVIFGALAYFVRHTFVVVMIPALSAMFGWLFGILSERNEWQEWYRTIRTDTSRNQEKQ